MIGAVCKLDDSGAHVTSASSEVGDIYLMHSGALLESLSVEPGGERRTLVCVGVRAGTVLVSVLYADDSPYDDQEFEVFPGAPLMVMTNGVPSEVTIEQVGSELPQLEALVGEGQFSLVEREFLVLNGDSGVRRGIAIYEDTVLGWKDVRPESGAPEEFVPWGAITGGGAQIVENDPDFNGHSSVIWGQDFAAFYRYSVEQDELWDFLGPSGEYLVLAIVKPAADRGVGWKLLDTSTGEGIELSVDGGYRFRFIATGNDPTAELADVTVADEIIEDGTPMVLVLRQSQTDGVDLYYQGRWHHLTDPVAAGAPEAVDNRFVIGAESPGDGPNLERNLKIADLRVWNFLPDSEQDVIDRYMAMAAEYGVDDSQRQGSPFVTGAYAMLRANRGVAITEDAIISNRRTGTSFIGDAVTGWSDTRPEAALPTFAGNTGTPSSLPAHELDPALDGHPVIHAYGGSPASPAGGHRLESANDTDNPIETDAFTVAGVFDLDGDLPNFSSAKGGVILSTGGFTATDVFVLSARSDGALRFFMAATGEDDVDITLPIGTQIFGHSLAIMVRVGNGSAQLSVEDLDTGEQGQITMPNEWPGVATGNPLVLFDFDTYYSGFQWFEGSVSELNILPGFVSNAAAEQWLTYVRRRYGF